MKSGRRRVVIVGGGLAGMAAAAALDAFCDVTLIEARHALGGRASSFDDPETGELLDNCQHVLLGCCTNLLDLYKRLGVAERIKWERTIYFRDGAGRRFGLFGVRGVAAPLNMGPAFVRFGLLSLGERAGLARAMLAMLRMGKSGREELADVPFGEWLKEHGQSDEMIRKFYDRVLISGLNENTRAAAGKYAIQVFQDALLAHSEGYVMGLPNCPLGELYEKLPCGDVRLSTRVEALEFASGANSPGLPPGATIRGVRLVTGEFMEADAVILATNHHAVQRWIPAEVGATDERFGQLAKLEAVPILGAHLYFDKPVMTDSHAALVDPPLQWLFRKDAEGKVLHGVISAAREWVGVPKAEALEQFEKQVMRLFPRSGAKLVRGVIVIEKRATFSPVPGSDGWRPGQVAAAGGVTNLFLAGDYTKTDWPATMEGAVRSGYLAAEGVLGRSFMKPDLTPQWAARWAGLGR